MSARRHPHRRRHPHPEMSSQHRLAHRQERRIPKWFHGLLDRQVAEDLLLRSPARPKEGLFLVRQSSNRGGCFVISVCTGFHVNHYLIETLESMFYVKLECRGERGRGIQACDLINLVECYKRLPLDISGLTLHQPLPRMLPVDITPSLSPAPSSKDNHNYIPLYVDHRYYVGKEDYRAGDLEATSFVQGEAVTILLKETKKWWFGYNSRGDLGYVPSSLLSPSYREERDGGCGLGPAGIQQMEEDDERVEISEFSKTDDEMDRRSPPVPPPVRAPVPPPVRTFRRPPGGNGESAPTETNCDRRTDDGNPQETAVVAPGGGGRGTPPPAEPPLVVGGGTEGGAASEIYVSGDYIAACVENHEQRLVDGLFYGAQQRRGCCVPDGPGGPGDREWVFSEDMDVALLDEQIVPDMDGDGLGTGAFESGGLRDDPWSEQEGDSCWSAANCGYEEGQLDTFGGTEPASDGRTGVSDGSSEPYDPVQTYFRLMDCYSIPPS